MPGSCAQTAFLQLTPNCAHENTNSLSDPVSPKKREDTAQLYTLTLHRSFTKRLSGAIQYLYNINASNIGAYDYDRQVISISVTAAF